MNRLLKILFGFLIVGAVVVGAYAWMQGREPATGGVELIPVTRGSIVEKAVAVGQIEPRVKFSVKSKLPGIVSRTMVDVGDLVEAGDPLFDIVPDPTPSELVESVRRVDAARTAYKRAEADWRRAIELSQQGILSGDELDATRETFELSKIELASARDSQQLTRDGRIDGGGRGMESIIRAPARGIVLQRLVDPGDPVVPLTSYQEGTQLATVADMSDLIFTGTVDEIDVGKLSVDVVARLKIGALPGQVVTGTLSRIAPQATEKDGARLFEVEIELDPVSDVVLRAGYSANADLVIREKTDILMIPERLVLFEDDGAKTFVEIPGETPDAEPIKVEIETGLSDGLNIEVLSGLSEESQVVQRPPRDVLG
jgi:HlyD family secretion protein